MNVMPRRPFGSTGEFVPALSMGCSPFRVDTASEHIAAVRRAVELGMNYFDTAPYYGNGQSQRVLGEALAQISEPVFVATKVGHLNDRASYRNADAILAQAHENLRVLGRDHVDLLQLHEAEWRGWWSDNEPSNVPINLEEALDYAGAPAMQALRKAREQGLCRFIGITGNTSALMGHVLKQVDVDSMLVAYNYDPIWRGAVNHAIPIAHEKGAAFISAGPLFNGKFAAVHLEWLDDPPAWMTADIAERYATLCEIRGKVGLSMPELAIRFVISDPNISTLLTASITVDQVQQNFDAAVAGPLPRDIHKLLNRIGLYGPEIRSWLFDFWKLM